MDNTTILIIFGLFAYFLGIAFGILIGMHIEKNKHIE